MSLALIYKHILISLREGPLIEDLVAQIKAVSDIHRLKLLRLLAEDEFCNCELVELFDLSQPAISQHLSRLKHAGLVTSRREGQWVYYQLTEDGQRFARDGFSLLFKQSLPSIGGMKTEVERLSTIDRESICSERDPRRLSSANQPIRVMFLCTGNSCRSQMAEGYLRRQAGNAVEVHSAGIEPHGVNPLAIQVMSERGVDIAGHTSKQIDPSLLQSMDYAVTLCGDAEERCPVTPPGVKRLHWPLLDPAKLTGTEEEVLGGFREVRDQIFELVDAFVTANTSGLIRGEKEQ